jgi:hypothetical protein
MTKTDREFVDECKKKLEDLVFPWHIGHINENNPALMDIDGADQITIAEDVYDHNARFIVSSPSDVQRLIDIIERQEKTLEKCKEQRNNVCSDYMNILHELGTDYRADWTIHLFDQYLNKILKGK